MIRFIIQIKNWFIKTIYHTHQHFPVYLITIFYHLLYIFNFLYTMFVKNYSTVYFLKYIKFYTQKVIIFYIILILLNNQTFQILKNSNNIMKVRLNLKQEYEFHDFFTFMESIYICILK